MAAVPTTPHNSPQVYPFNRLNLSSKHSLSLFFFNGGFTSPLPPLKHPRKLRLVSQAASDVSALPFAAKAGQDRLLKVPVSNIRNFSIIAHIDHGKSTLADKLLETTGTVQKREMKEQFLDNMDLERERGITIKLQAARMRYVYENEAYCLNLIDTPGHVDFSYEVSRSLAACEGALLVVDASQGVEAQTLANVYLALENNLEIIPVLNKIDLPGADADRVAREIEEIIGLDCSNAIRCSAKEGIGITEILDSIVRKIPPPPETASKALRALIFDSYYDAYRGVIAYFRIIDGTLKKGDRVYFMNSKKDYFADEIGVLSPTQMQVDELYAGEVGYLSASIRSVADARVGDTVTHFGRKAEGPLPGYQKATPMVFCGLFPLDADQFTDLRDALEKLQLNDAALKFEPETSSAMGFGFRCGFLGLLHMEIIQERLEREYNLSLITTAPSVVYRVITATETGKKVVIFGLPEIEMALSLEQYRSMYEKESTIKLILTKRIERQRKKSIGVSIKNGNRIPEHLIIEILSRLPVKALLQFKSVCKLWYEIIKSSHFISKHLRNYYDNNNNWRDCLIVQYSVTQAGELNVFELLLDDKKNRVLSYQEIDTPVYNTYLCGPCDGIYYLWCFSYDAPTRSLWNPALNEFKGLPDITWTPNIPPKSAWIRESYGFGYDSNTNDYKVILILGYSDKRDENSRMTDNPMSILIYSLRTNSWRYWGDIDTSYNLELNKSYCFVNGCYYWLASCPVSRRVTYGWDYEMIVSFDINGDTCQEIPLPEFEGQPDYGSQLIVYQDSIAFVSVPNDNTNFCIWTWNEGVWTRKFSMNLDSGVRGAFSVWRDNMLVFGQGYRKLVLCDTNTKEIFALDDSQAGGCENVCAYKESLVSIKDFGKDMKRKGRTS